ncbi:MAG: PilZ domain-containing protein [gamma proteobacterium endosymbiont of Lamellibrachia anaximandri]|nr:PilZ domain-containing protein [gamma proteobacterium endosymbiont of Lamellibrachia anaximandri]MBL3619221.1 PilZ domain-containing protein [gamma proteobacterium endosymbiont of Lamellibrachia anaximandri]
MYIKKPFQHDEDRQKAEDDRRQIKRRHLIYYLRVWDTDYEQLLGHVVDISSEGLMLLSDQPIPKNKEFSMEIRLPDLEGNPQKIDFRAACCWSSNAVNQSFYDSGFSFLNSAPEAIDTVRQLIKEYGFKD